MRHTIVLILLLAIYLTGCSNDNQGYNLSQWLEQGIVIDTRSPGEYAAGHIPGSTLIPYEVIAREISRVVENKDTPIILYCRSGRRAGIAEKTLKEMGYINVVNLGGLKAAANAITQARE